MLRRITMVLALLVIPTLAAAQGRARATGRGGASLGLTHDQTHELQQALKEMGCYEGRVDGVVGPRTRQAIACARRERDVTGEDPNELLRALGLSFTVSDTRGWSPLMRGGSAAGDREARRQGARTDTSARGERGRQDDAERERRQGRGRDTSRARNPRDTTRDTTPR